MVYKGDRVMNTLQDLIKKYAAQYKEQVVAWRRHIHSHPELSGEEKNTSLFIQKVLGELGIPFVNDVSDYAVIGKIEGTQPGPVIALRADIDALPIHEGHIFHLHHQECRYLQYLVHLGVMLPLRKAGIRALRYHAIGL